MCFIKNIIFNNFSICKVVASLVCHHYIVKRNKKNIYTLYVSSKFLKLVLFFSYLFIFSFEDQECTEAELVCFVSAPHCYAVTFCSIVKQKSNFFFFFLWWAKRRLQKIKIHFSKRAPSNSMVYWMTPSNIFFLSVLHAFVVEMIEC